MFAGDPAVTPCDLLDAADVEALTILDGSDEVAGIQQAVAVTCIQPCKAAAEELDAQCALFQVHAVQVGDLILAAFAGLQYGGFLAYCAVVEIEAGHGVIALRMLGFLLQALDAQHGLRLLAVGRQDGRLFLKLHHAVGTRIGHLVAEDASTAAILHLLHSIAEHGLEVLTIEHIIAQDEATGFATEELTSQHKSLSQTIRYLLYFVLQAHAQATTIAQQFAEHRQIARRTDDKHFANTGQHECRKRIVDHRLVVHRHDLLTDSLAQRIEARGASACQNNTFHICSF